MQPASCLLRVLQARRERCVLLEKHWACLLLRWSPGWFPETRAGQRHCGCPDTEVQLSRFIAFLQTQLALCISPMTKT